MARKRAGAGEHVRDEYLDALGQNIKAARQRTNLTQKELAERIGLSVSWIYLVEDGQMNAQVNSLRKVAEACGVSVQSLLPPPDIPDEYGASKEADEAFETVIGDLNRSLGLLHRLNALRKRR